MCWLPLAGTLRVVPLLPRGSTGGGGSGVDEEEEEEEEVEVEEEEEEEEVGGDVAEW